MADDNQSKLLLWKPTDLILFLSNDCNNHQITQAADARNEFEIEIKEKDNHTATLNVISHDVVGMSLPLDLLVTITKLGEQRNNRGEVMHFVYIYSRSGVSLRFEVLPLSEDFRSNVLTLEFVFGQYCYVPRSNFDNEELPIENLHDTQLQTLTHDSISHNAVAEGLISMGYSVRYALKTGGVVLGASIRSLGQSYTQSTLSRQASEQQEGRLNNSSETSVPSSPASTSFLAPTPTPVTRSASERALSVRKQAETFHAGARTLTSTVLYPVRQVGKAVAGIANSNLDPNSRFGCYAQVFRGPISKAILEAVNGLGNGLSSSFKGVTEFLGEVGEAVSDCAMSHSRAVHGNEYAQLVTQQYVSALGEVGLAGYKLTAVATLGLAGLAADAALEGTTQLSGVYDLLRGPVLLQGPMDLAQLPFFEPKEVYAVLRPWSLSFYKNSTDFTRKPLRIISCNMLDALPRLRLRPIQARLPVTPHSQIQPNDLEEESKEALDVDRDRTSSIGTFQPLEEDIDPRSSTQSHFSPSFWSSTLDSHSRNSDSPLLSRLRGGNRTHIELSTVDCSSYLLYPPIENIETWFTELQQATKRSEPVWRGRAKGAEDEAVRRRLAVLPRSIITCIQIKQLVAASHEAVLNQLTGTEPAGEDASPADATTSASVTAVSGILSGSIAVNASASQSAQSSLSWVAINDNGSEGGDWEGSGSDADFEMFFSQMGYGSNTCSGGSASGPTFTSANSNNSSCVSEPITSAEDVNERMAESEEESARWRELPDYSVQHSTAPLVHAGQVTPVCETVYPRQEPGHGTGAENDTPPITSHVATVSAAVSTALQQSLAEVRHGFGRLTDPLRDSVVASGVVWVTVTPITHSGAEVTQEEESSEKAPLSRSRITWMSGPEQQPQSAGFLIASWNRIANNGSGIQGEPGSLPVRVGSKACIDAIECEYLQLAVRATTVAGNTIEIGRGRLYLDSLPQTRTSADRDSGRCLKSPGVDSIGPDAVENPGGLTGLVGEVRGADSWVDLQHRRSGRLVGRLLVNAGQLLLSASHTQPP